jgi:hypothetical protein
MPPYVEIGEFNGKERIFLFVDWEPGIADKCKQVLGYKWAPDYERKPWTYPLRMDTCLALRNVWGRRMQIGPKLTAWARREAAKASQIRALGRLADSDLERVQEKFPALWNAMSKRTYQRSGADFLARLLVGADFDEPGLGKTATVLAAIVQADRWDGRHLVICPKTAIFSTWEHEVKKWTDGRVYGMPDGKALREEVLMDFIEDEKPGARFLVVHPNMIQMKISHYCKRCGKWERELEPQHYAADHKLDRAMEKCDWPELFEKDYWDSILADECQKYLLKLRPAAGKKPHSQPQWAHGMRALIKATKPGGLRIPMTGTPFRGKEENIFGILHWMDPETFSSYWRWAEAFLEVKDEEHSKLTGDTHKVVGALRADKEAAFYDMLDGVSLRRTRKEVRSDLPDMEPQHHWVQLEGEHERQYEEFREKGVAELESGVVERLGVLSEITRLRQFAFGPMDVTYKMVTVQPTQAEIDFAQEQGQEAKPRQEQRMVLRPIVRKSPKVQLLMDMLEARGAFGEFEGKEVRKFVIASQWTSFLDAIGEMLDQDGIPYLMITGRVTGKRREEAASSFRSPKGPRLLLLNTTAGGTSLTLDEYCDEMFILDETWIKDDQTQLEGRINNRGQNIRPRFAHYIRTVGTVEEGIALTNDEQWEMQTRILDRRRGVQVALSLLQGGS